jgi:putative tricarboxylic transport membrane protein
MQRIHQAAAVAMLALAAFVMWQSWSLEYYTKLGPGPGFFPFWLGVMLGGLVLAWLVQVSRQTAWPARLDIFPERSGILRILTILAALGAMAAVIDRLGFQLSMLLFLGFALRVLGRQAWWVTALVALLGSIGAYHIFGRYLDVQLPAASVAFLARLGL